MTATVFDQWSQASKVYFEPVLELNGITTRLCGDLARQNLRGMNELAQCGAEQLQGLSYAKGVEEAMNVQGRCAAKMIPQLFQHAQNNLEAVLRGASAYGDWFSKEANQFAKAGGHKPMSMHEEHSSKR